VGRGSLFDGARTVSFERLGPGRVRWDGFEAFVDEHALLWLHEPAPLRDVLARCAELGVEHVSVVSERLGLHRVRASDPRRSADERSRDGLALAVELAARLPREVRAVLPDLRIPHVRRQIDVPPSDTLYADQWYLRRIDVEDAWRLEDGADDVTIVIVDNGCDATHPDLAGKLDPGLDVVDDDTDPSPHPSASGNEHGTACAGLAAATTDEAHGIAGVCAECRLRCVRLLGGDDEPIPLSADVRAFDFALEVEAEIVSNSWGFRDPIATPAPLAAAIERVLTTGRGGLGSFVVFAVGNDNRLVGDRELAALPGVLGVGATNNFDEAAPFSNRGEAVDVVAPAGTLAPDVVGAAGADPGDFTSLFGGTSSACPLVAGVAGLLVSAAPDATREALQDAIVGSAEPSFFATPDERGHDDTYGYGLVQPAAALRACCFPEAIDAGIDAGEPDAGVTEDAGVDEDGGGGGCGCATSRASDVPSALLFLALLVARSRRRA
jgi:subtilisin family serine protease